ncbi:hypothetical protein GQ53DRAFT_841395 [Thozetella sp. PMI_491]|nr:hypothetical protein GQ53DRAFT_841395 [Thozetella sp. PMI_491]
MATRADPDAVTAPSLEMVCLDGLTPDKIVEYLEAATQFPLKTNPVTFQYPGDLINDLLDRLEGIGRKLSYDYKSGTVCIDMMPESALHFQFQHCLCRAFEDAVENVAATMTDPEIRRRMKGIKAVGTTDINVTGSWCMQPDIALQEFLKWPPSLYFDDTYGQVAAVPVLDLGYPHAKRAKANLLVADSSLQDDQVHRWIQRGTPFYDENLADQPAGQVGFYISDLLPEGPLPQAFYRPSAAELATGVSRDPQIVLTYEQLRSIFLDARDYNTGAIQARVQFENRRVR